MMCGWCLFRFRFVLLCVSMIRCLLFWVSLWLFGLMWLSCCSSLFVYSWFCIVLIRCGRFCSRWFGWC